LIFFQIFFGRFGLTTHLESREKAYKKEKIFLQKSLTRPNRPQYNGVSQGDTPPPPPGGGGGGGEQLSCQGVGTVRAAALLLFLI